MHETPGPHDAFGSPRRPGAPAAVAIVVGLGVAIGWEEPASAKLLAGAAFALVLAGSVLPALSARARVTLSSVTLFSVTRLSEAGLLGAGPRGARVSAATSLTALLLASSANAVHSVPSRQSALARWATEGGSCVRVVGRVAVPPVAFPARPADRFGRRMSHWVLQVERFEGTVGGGRGGGGRSVPGRLRIRVDGSVPSLSPGDRVRCLGRLDAAPERRNDGEFSMRSLERARGRCAVLRVPSPRCIEPAARPGSALSGPGRLVDTVSGLVVRARSGLARCFSRWLDAETAGLLAAILLGIRDGLPAAAREPFERTGTAHFLAISGLHVHFAAAVAEGLLRRAGLRTGPREAALVGSMLAYAALAGLRPSVVRAAATVTALRCARISGRSVPPADALAIAATILLASRPGDLLDPSFRLSFAAVAGILAFGRGRRTVPAPHGIPDTPGPRRPREGPAWWLGRRLSMRVRSDLRITGAATLGTLPWVVRDFHAFAPVSFIANLVLYPVVGVLLVGGFGLIALAGASALGSAIAAPPVGRLVEVAALPVSGFLEVAARVLFGIAKAIDGASSPVWLAAPPTAAIIAHHVALGAGIGGFRRSTRWSLTVATALALPAWLPLESSSRGHRATPHVDVLDVGHGMAVIAALPGGRTLVYDAGSSGRPDIGARTVAPALFEKGVRRIDVLVLSHADADHVNGVPRLLDRFAVGRIVVPRGFDRGPAGRAWLSRISSLAPATPITFACDGAILLERPASRNEPGVVVEVLHPPSRFHFAGAEWNENEASLALSIRVGSVRCLLTGDVEEWGTGRLVERRASCDVLLLPHHGAANPVTERLIGSSGASIAIVSAEDSEGLRQRLARWRALVPVLATSEGGRLRIDVSADRPRVSSFLSPSPPAWSEAEGARMLER